jgi:pimeloyl-ACP methyl ester carboxylesterase
VEAYQLLYRTTAINNSAIATVTTVFKPLIPQPDRFISFHTAYDSASTLCDPSYNYQLGAPQTDLINSAELLIIQVYLSLGYIVASPDYEGADAAFSAGRLEGMGVLDGMRPVASFPSLGLSNNPMIVGAGYSGGSIATGWAASLQPTYAPELDMKGWVHGGTPANLTGTLVNINNTPFSGFLPAAIAGLTMPSTIGAEVNPLLNRILTPNGKSTLDFAKSHCFTDNLLKHPEWSLFSTDVQSLGSRLLYNPAVHPVVLQNTMGIKKQETPTAPVFMYHASQDEVIPYANASTLFNSWCSNGVSVRFTTFANGGHVTTEVVGLPDAVEFVQAAFAGTTASGCSQNTKLDNLLNPIALGVELEPILTKLAEVLTAAGERDSNIKQNLSVLQNVISW